jgi:hypothetical protein
MSALALVVSKALLQPDELRQLPSPAPSIRKLREGKSKRVLFEGEGSPAQHGEAHDAWDCIGRTY